MTGLRPEQLPVPGLELGEGPCWDPATETLYWIDAPASVGQGDVVPDGLAVDAQGGIWIAQWGGAVLCRHHPDGSVDRVVEFPHAHVTSCAFGGPGLDRLYVTTAAGPADPAGGLFVLTPGVTGLPGYPFRG